MSRRRKSSQSCLDDRVEQVEEAVVGSGLTGALIAVDEAVISPLLDHHLERLSVEAQIEQY